MDSVFCKAALIHPPVILGRRLKPFSCYHALTLMQFDSPYIEGGAVTERDFLLAFHVCSDDYDHRMRTMLRMTNSKLASWLFMLRCMASNIDTAMDDFSEYVSAFIEIPSVFSSGKSHRSGVPWPFYLVDIMLKNIPTLSYADAWNMPVTLAGCHKVCLDEANGSEVMGDDMLAQIKKSTAEGAKLWPQPAGVS